MRAKYPTNSSLKSRNGQISRQCSVTRYISSWHNGGEGLDYPLAHEERTRSPPRADDACGKRHSDLRDSLHTYPIIDRKRAKVAILDSMNITNHFVANEAENLGAFYENSYQDWQYEIKTLRGDLKNFM